ncbi:carbohydrate kinase family protein [Fructobacillus sp. M1-13]|uniref:Carbohydrate kinase family protein n=1 Tax=Fructobacillus papyriferae TaxID=2713171 RepID=A0ABS5QNB8_9LACO|nr:carbohydrate kinase family protein [Fructobacillus papyriferae]MBS9334594.1 carbohydrate kinase family protein [Fructobacillus papyriferae]MCD2158583.1 carbohydrate kinase family protein [Fructobacillus papyriferae]
MKINLIGTTFVDVLFKMKEVKILFDNISFAEEGRLTPGGNGSNVAINLCRKGLDVDYYGQVGNDTHGQFLKEQFAHFGINMEGLRVSPVEQTGMSLILVNQSGERSVTSFQGSNDYFDFNTFTSRGDAVVIAGIGLLPNVDSRIGEILQETKANGIPVFLGGSPNIAVIRRFLMSGQYRDVDFFFLNIREACDVARTSDVLQAGYFFQKFGVKNVFITAGPNGIHYFGEGQVYQYVRIRSVQPCDSTGAGDAFMAGTIHHYLLTQEIDEAIFAGHQMALETINKIGAVPVKGDLK